MNIDQLPNSNSIQTNQSFPGSTSILEEYGQLRWQKAILDAKLKEIESLAIDEALDIFSSGVTKGKQIVYSSGQCDITIQFRSEKLQDSDNQDLEHLAQLIDIEMAKAQKENQAEIDLINHKIDELQQQLILLGNTPEGLQYQAEYQKLKQQLTTKKPILSVKLK